MNSYLAIQRNTADTVVECRRAATAAEKAAAADEPISTFKVKVPGIPGYESRDVKTEAATKLRAYEFPDWQFLKAEFDVQEQ